MTVSLPERTVDAWVAIYIAQRVPDILLWAPQQTVTPDLDIAVVLPGPGKLFVLENKAPYTNRGHHFELDVRQLWNYLVNPVLRDRTFYVLPCPPFAVRLVGGPGLVPALAGSRLAGHPWPPRPPGPPAPGEPCEEWFRVVPVEDLWDALMAPPSPLGPRPKARDPRWPRGGPPPEPNPKTKRLKCPLPAKLGESLHDSLPAKLGESLHDFIDGLLACRHPGLRVAPGGSSVGAGARYENRVESPASRALIAFAPAASLPGWDRTVEE